MNPESADQVQGQESASIKDTTILQNQLLDTSSIQLQNLETDKITQDCSLENLTSSLQISDSQQSTPIQVSCEAHKSLIQNLYYLLVCEKLPATDESLNLSMITNKTFSASEIKDNEEFDKKIEEFVEILEVLSDSCGCDKIMNHDCAKDCNKIEEMTKNVQLRIEKIKTEKSKLILLIKEANLEKIAQKYETLKADQVLMKILFHKFYRNEIELTKNETLQNLKNYQSKNQKFILKDICDSFERNVVPKTQKLISSIVSADDMTYDTLHNNIKSTILNSYIDFQGFYIPLQELTKNSSEYLQALNTQQILDIIQNGFTKVSKIEQLSIPFYLKRTFIWQHMDSYVDDNQYMEGYLHYTENNQKRQFIKDHTKTYYNIKEEFKSTGILILTDELGSGKTTTLKYLARRFKEDNNKLWISYIDAKKSAKIFENIKDIQDWSVDGVTKFLLEILGLSGIEIPIFKQKFKDNRVILLWDHFDHNYQQILIDFAWNIKQLTENKQVFATRCRYSEKLAQKFDRTAYKFIPYTYEQIEKFHRRTEDFMNFYVGYWKFFKFCDTIGFARGYRDYMHSIFIKNNIFVYKIFLLALVDSKIDLEVRFDLSLLFERVYKKQMQASPEKLTEKDEKLLQKVLQAWALKKYFGDELTKSLKTVTDYINVQPPISFLEGFFTVNFDDNSIDFQHKIIEEYFIMKFYIDNIVYVVIKDVSVKEAKKLVTIFAMILTQNNYKCLLNLIKDIFYLEHRNPTAIREAQDNIFRIVKKAQYWPKVTKLFSPKELKHIVHDNKFRTTFEETEFWSKLLNEIQIEKEKNEEKEKVKRVVQHQEAGESKIKDKEVKDKPTIKGVTTMKKLGKNNEISHQLNEFLDDMETDESD